MSANTETTMSPAELMAAFDGAVRIVSKYDHDGSALEDLKEARTAVAALIERNAELERLCDATYVAKGADAYNHACETMEAWQRLRAEAGKDPGCEGSLCDGLSWLHSRVDSLEAERDAQVERVKALETALKSFPEEPNPYMYRMAQARARAALAACKPSS